MSTFSVHFDTDNAAFDPECGGDAAEEIARILIVIAKKVRHDYAITGNVVDVNGNTVGHYDWVKVSS